ncbi:MAG: glycine--tRNA ligase [Candidatus Methanomethylicota archaeon]|jgi:glycyl-tRNA synthetase|uniref:glycine--tRNA ligase n=1 Tax=Thermoproteota archaeon TaxID=2056631 RepID=A0A520KH67_9CREN|nr:MAG: glycine--tRNA ligase [Candidatus Verstraetearchaeota archaeon]TDA38003.1 MAG: glycine--tRNA ligase [Candidatus Verstraetearchaeota archaeon]
MDKYDKIIDLAKRRGFFTTSCEIYGGVAGFLDFGPIGTLLKRNIENKWREFFIYKHYGLIYEIETPIVMPSKVFEASGHVEHFTDFIVECLSCHRKFRADHVILYQVGEISGLEGKSAEELEKIIQENNIRCPECKGKLGKVSKFNLLFTTNVGPYSENIAYMRPEAAQGMFVNFKYIYTIMREKLPIGLAQIGKVLRNEISPRQGPIRLREFTIMEIELFFDPKNPECNLLNEVSNEKINLLTENIIIKGENKPIELTIEEAIKEKIILSEWQAYFMALSKIFLEKIGVPKNKQMFIEKLPNERAHYSAQTFDQVVELERWGWTEVSGHAYRTDYDLLRHQNYSGQDLKVFRRFTIPKKEYRIIAIPKIDIINNIIKNNDIATKIISIIKNKKAEELKKELERGSIIIDDIEIRPEFVEFKTEEITITGEHFIPHVSEPSFGAERLVYVAMEYAYREKNNRIILSLPKDIAPIKIAVFPLVNKDGLREKAIEVYNMIKSKGFIVEFDDDGSIGRRYARADEIGIPLAITIDYKTMEDNTVTIRNRDTWEQERISISNIMEYLNNFFSK